ncbi:MAG: DUF4192 family protein, partial [Stackebrandtia sp.]
DLASRFDRAVIEQRRADARFRDEGLRLLHQLLDAEGGTPDARHVAALEIFLAVPKVREAGLKAVLERGGRACLPLWTHMVRHLPPGRRAIAANLAAVAAWHAGDGVLAAQAVRISLSDDSGPGNLLARALDAALHAGMPPDHLEEHLTKTFAELDGAG